jgi:hypothetical protein
MVLCLNDNLGTWLHAQISTIFNTNIFINDQATANCNTSVVVALIKYTVVILS